MSERIARSSSRLSAPDSSTRSAATTLFRKPPKRLGDFMGDRPRQFPGYCKPHRMDKVTTIFRFGQLSTAAALALDDQRGDHTDQEQERNGGCDYLVRVSFPQTRFSELHDCAARNGARGDAPSLELPPVDVQGSWHDRGQVQRGGWFAVEQPAYSKP